MQKGILYNKMDCLDVLETLEDKTYSLIYLDIPSCIGKYSKRVMYDESRLNPVAALRRERGCKLQDLSRDEIELFIEECENDRKKEYEKYLFKIMQNCYRVLTDDGVVVFREVQGEPDYVDLKHLLDNLFHKFGIKVLDHIGLPQAFDLIHFYSKKKNRKFPEMYELQPLDRYPYEDEKGRYRLLPLVCPRSDNNKNYFEWNGYLPSDGKGWGYSKKSLDDLNKKGYIVQSENIYDNVFPKLKYYREEHQVPVSAIWNEKNLFDRIFGLFTSKGDKVLGIYEGLGFACSAESNKMIWCSVYPREVKSASFRGKGLIEGKYRLIESLQNHSPRTYNENIPSIVEHIKEGKMFLRDAVKDYELKERPPVEVGDTIDEVLVYYIDKWVAREGSDISKCMKKCNLSRNIYYKMAAVNRGERKREDRDKETVLKIAVHTDMGLSETVHALALAGKAFEENNVADETIVSWLCSERRDVKELRKLFILNFKRAKWPDKEIREFIYYFFDGTKSKKDKEAMEILC